MRSASEDNWWRRLERRHDGNWSEALRVVQAGPYNRVEGLPIELGPVLSRRTPWGSVRLDAAAIVRTGSSFDSDTRRLRPQPARRSAHSAAERGIGVGARVLQRRRSGRELAAVRSRGGARVVSRAARLPRLLPASRRRRVRHAVRRARHQPHRALRRRAMVVARAAQPVHVVQ